MMIPYLNLNQVNKNYFYTFKASMEDIFENSIYVGGKYVSLFEEQFAQKNGSKFAVGTSSGTDCLSIILNSLELSKKGFIYYPENTFIGTILSGLQLGHKFKPYPVNKETLNADQKSIKHIGDDASAVILVYLYGHSFDVAPFVDFCKEKDIPLLEDVSQAHFQYFRGKRLGTFGIASYYSLFPGKNLGGIGDGGIICTDNEELAKKAKALTNYGMHRKHEYAGRGFNSRLDSINAAFLLEKLKNYDNIVKERRNIVNKYYKAFKGKINMVMPYNGQIGASVWHIFCLRLDSRQERDSLMNHLEDNGIKTNIHYPKQIHEVECWRDQIEGSSTFDMGDKILSIPCHEGLNKKDTDFIIQKVLEWEKQD